MAGTPRKMLFCLHIQLRVLSFLTLEYNKRRETKVGAPASWTLHKTSLYLQYKNCHNLFELVFSLVWVANSRAHVDIGTRLGIEG